MRPFAPAKLKLWDRFFAPIGAVIGLVLRFFMSFIRSGKGVLIVRPGGMGDLVLLTLACEKLKLNPKSYVWLIETRSEPWAKHLGLNYKCYDRNPILTLLRLAAGFDIVINSEQLFGLAQAFAVACTHRRGKLVSFSTNRMAKCAHDVCEYNPGRAPEIIEFQKLLKKALSVHSEIDVQKTKRRMSAKSGLVVAIAGLGSPTRDIGLEKWLNLVSEWAGDQQFSIISGPNERTFARELSEKFGPQAELVGGDFDSLCRLVAEADRVFTIDGGMSHVASYYGVPADVIFTASDDVKWGPLAEGSSKIYKLDLPCHPCIQFGQEPPCPYHYACKDVSLKSDRERI